MYNKKLLNRLRRRLSVIDDCCGRARDAIDESEGTESDDTRYIMGQLGLIAEAATMAISLIVDDDREAADRIKNAVTEQKEPEPFSG